MYTESFKNSLVADFPVGAQVTSLAAWQGRNISVLVNKAAMCRVWLVLEGLISRVCVCVRSCTV